MFGSVGFNLIEKHSVPDSAYFFIETVAIILNITGGGTFLGVIAGITERVINRSEKLRKHQKLQRLEGTFFSKQGTRLLLY